MTSSAGSELKIAACQMKSIDDVEVNKNQIRKILKSFESPETQVGLVSFPENALYFRLKPHETNSGILESDAFFVELSQWAKKNKTAIHLGSVALKEQNPKLKSATLWIDQNGEISFPYSKIHLFDVDVDGEKPVRESDVFTAGAKPAILEMGGFKFGLSICYDLRFSELYLAYAKAEVDVILIPSAFLVTTGAAHWHSLMRARAIECQAYVIASAQGGDHISATGEKRSTYGHTLIVDPWGTIVSEVVTEGEQNFVTHVLQKKMIEKIRKQIPMKHHRRL